MGISQNNSTSAPLWAFNNGLRIDGRPFSLENRAYQVEIMSSVCDDGKVKTHEVIRKGSQIGITMGKVVEIAHGAIHGLYQKGIIYYFPSNTAVEVFSGSRFKPFLNDNEMIKKYISPHDMNAVKVRRIGNTNVNFFGCSATTIIGGQEADSVWVRSTPADWVLLDERDLFSDVMAAQVNQRLGDSKIGRRSDIGTPKLPDDGVDRIYGKSDMRRWQIKCECGKYTCMESDFPQCIGIDKDGNGFPMCIHCGRRIHRSYGEWIPDWPDRDVVGYWVSQMLNPNRNLARVLKECEDPEAYDSNEAEFTRTVRGLPYVSAEDQLTESDVFACCTGDGMRYSHPGPCAMGVDVHPKTLNVVIGHRIGKDRYRIVRMARVPDYPALHDLAKKFNVKSAVLDAQPETHANRDFQKAEPYAVYLCFYSEHLKTFDTWNQETKIVTVNRTEIFDASHHLVKSPGKLLLPRSQNAEVKIFAHQMCQCAKTLEEDKHGNKTYRYRKTGDKQEHYRNAVNYFMEACKKVGIPESRRDKQKEVTQDMRFHL